MKYPDLPDKTLFKPYEAAAFFSVSTKTVYYWIATGFLFASKIGGTIRIPRESIIKAIETGRKRRLNDENVSKEKK